MLAGLPTVVEDVLVLAPGVLEGAGEDGHAVKGTLPVNSLSEGVDGRSTPFGEESYRAEGVEYAPKQV